MKLSLFVTILIVANCVQVEPSIETIKKMENSQFGKTILDTIALELQNKDSADDLIKGLRTREDSLQEQQDKEDEEVLVNQNKCVADLEKLVSEIEATKKRLKEIKQELQVKIPLKQQKEEERQDQQDFKALLLEKMDELEAQKEIKEQEWKEEQEQHDQAAYIFTSAKQALSESIHSSFLQLDNVNQQTLIQVTSKFNLAKKQHFKKQSWNHMFKVLATITSKQHANSDAIKRVIDLIDKILDKISESREIERKDFQMFVQEYNKTKNGLQNKLDQTQSNIDQLTTQIDALTKIINLLQEEQTDQEQRLKNKQQEHDEVEIQCDDEAKAYSQRRQARSDQLEILSDAIALLTSQIRLLKKFVTDKLN